MRILVIGATGFIGSAVCARLAADGHEIRAVSRHKARPGLVPVTPVAFDMGRARNPADWLPLLDGIDAVVNCAGSLQSGFAVSLKGVHAVGAAALFSACEQRRIRHVIHISAVGIEDESRSAFSRTKRQGEKALMERDLDWVILRPSVVVGRAAYGGSALLRGLAALPVVPAFADAGLLQIVHLDDVVETVACCLGPDAPKRQILELVGPDRYGFAETVALFRRWLRFPPAKEIRIPNGILMLMAKIGDAAGHLGWSTPMRSNAVREARRGAVGDPDAWIAATNIYPQNVEATLAREPASVQERWFARLYLLKPAVLGVFGLFWIATGLISLGPGWEYGIGLLREGGLGENVARLTLSAGAVADVVIGLAILWRPSARNGLYAALAITLIYAVVGTILVPQLWIDPLGPMLKIGPVLMLNLVALAILDDR